MLQEEVGCNLWAKSMEFVERNIKVIQGRARKFLPYSGEAYSLDDFIQEAYLCAIDAVRQCELKCRTCEDEILECETYPKLFWGILRDRYSKMASIPSHEKLLGNGASKMPAHIVEIESTKLAVKSNYGSYDDVEDKLTEDKISKFLSVMDTKSRKAWEYYLGRNGCGRALNRKEIAEKMGFLHPQRVSQLINKGLQDVQKNQEVLCLLLERQ